MINCTRTFPKLIKNGSKSSQIICPNLREFGQVIMRDHLWDSLNRISGWVAQFLFCQVNSISDLSQLSTRIFLNLDK